MHVSNICIHIVLYLICLSLRRRKPCTHHLGRHRDRNGIPPRSTLHGLASYFSGPLGVSSPPSENAIAPQSTSNIWTWTSGLLGARHQHDLGNTAALPGCKGTINTVSRELSVFLRVENVIDDSWMISRLCLNLFHSGRGLGQYFKGFTCYHLLRLKCLALWTRSPRPLWVIRINGSH